MTGTAMTEASEFWKIYQLDVIAVPTNRPLKRMNYPDVIYRSERREVPRHRGRNRAFESLGCRGIVRRQRTHRHDYQRSAGRDRYTTARQQARETIPRSKIRQLQKRGRPVLVGTVSIEKSERLSSMLDKRGIKHQVLNAKHHKREAEIVAQAGRKHAVTIATNMAGRGTDIILGGNPETMAWALLQDKYATRLDVPREEWTGLIQQIEEAKR